MFDFIFDWIDDAWDVVDDFIIEPIFGGGEDSIFNTIVKPIAGAGLSALQQSGSSTRTTGSPVPIRRSGFSAGISTRPMGSAGTPQGLRSLDPIQMASEWDARMRRWAYLEGTIGK